MKWVEIMEGISVQNNSIIEFSHERGYLDTGGLIGSKITQIEYFTFDKKPSRANQNVSVGNIILARMHGTNKVKIIEGDESKLMVSTGFLVLNAKETYDRKFLLHYLSSEKFQREKDELCSGATQKAINNSNFQKLKIPSISLETQKKIAAILDKADELRQNDRKILEKYDQLAQSVFLEMFGDPGRNSKGWEKVQLSEIINDGPQNGLYKPAKNYGKGTPIIRIDSFNNSVVDISNLKRVELDNKEIDRYEITEGEFLINRVNSMSHLGKCGLVPKIHERTVFESNMMRVKFCNEKVSKYYMLFILSSKYIKNQIIKSSKDAVNQSSINQNDVNSFKIPLPPIGYQNQFSSIIENINIQKGITLQSLQKSEELFQSLLQRAFRGEL